MHCQIQRQLTIALENYPGRLAAMSSAIASSDGDCLCAEPVQRGTPGR
ncbi:MAG: hypothetical protein ACYTXA_32275 [Nostoc sp.]